jgi:phage terminase large subunit-like protein
MELEADVLGCGIRPGDGRYCAVLLEQEPGSAGLDSVKATARALAGYVVIAIRPTGAKDVRAEPLAS